MPVFLLSERRKSGKCSFTAANSSGKSARQLFLRSERRKSGKCGLTASSSSGKAALRLFLRSGRRKSSRCNFTAPDSSGKPAWQRFSASRGGKAATAVWLHEYTYKPFLSLSLCHLSPSRRYSYTRSTPVGPISNQMYFIQAGPFSE